jgi:hypothetical protein
MKKSFVCIFRQGSKKLTEEEQKRRTEEVRAWALQHVKDGRGLDPRVLGEEVVHLGDGLPAGATDVLVRALNFIEADDFAEAVNIAKTHPGLHYGVRLEVRQWTDPRAAQAR